MSLLYPLYLLGALAAVMPVLIHLLTRRQRRKILFSDLSLLRQVDAEEAARYKLEHLRLMILRAAMCVILTLIFCQPVLKMGQGVLRRPGQGNVAAFVIDNSRSMGTSEGGVVRFERARQAALEILDQLRGEDEAIAIFASSRTRASHAQPTTFREEVREALEEASVTSFSSAVPQALELAIQHVLKSPFSNKEIYLFTDAQKTAFDSAPAAWPPNSNTINGYLGYLSEAIDLPNVELTEIAVAPISAKPGEPVEVRAKTRGHGARSAGDVELDLEVGPTNRLHRKITLVPGRDEEVIFPTFQRSSAPVDSGVVRMQPDVLDTDNHLYYALPEGRPLRILMSQGGGDDRVLNFIQVALRLLAKMPVIPPLSADFIKIQDIAVTLGEQPTDVILIANPGRVDEPWIQTVTAWMRDGGNLVLAMGSVVGEWVNQLLVPQWIPLELKRWEISKKEASHPRAFDFSNAWMDRFEEEESSDWRSVSVWGGWEFDGKGDSAVPSQNLITLERGSPLLWQRSIGLGTLTLWMSSLDDSLNDLPHGGMYLAFWGEFMRSLAEKKGLKAAFTAGSQVPVEVIRSDDRPAEIRLIPPDGKPQVLAVAGPKLTQTLFLSRTEQVGIYKIEFNPGRVERVTPASFAVNIEPGEGDLTGLSLEALEKLLPFPVERFRGGESIASQITYSRYGFSLWPFVLFLLLGAMMLETWWSRPT